MAQKVCNGVRQVDGVDVFLKRVPELIPEEIINSNQDMKEGANLQKDVPVAKVSDLEECDGLILGSPTRFGNMCSQMRNFLDQTGELWQKGSLIGKPAGFFTSTASIHGGQETTLISMIQSLLHHGMIIVGVPYSNPEIIKKKTGGTPYGASHVVGVQTSFTERTAEEKNLCISLGKRVAQIAVLLKNSRKEEK